MGLGVLLLAGLAVGPRAEAGTEPDVRRDAAVQAVERVLPSIVNISTETLVEVRDPLEALFQDFFGPYYRRRPPDAQKSLGSGVIIDEAGYILTNFHVVRRANRITVTLVDGREFEAKELSRTAKSDVALLKLVTRGNEKFQAIRFAGDDDLLLGETVLALGDPFGLGVSVSRGILSSKTRRPPVDNGPLEMEDWLQTDAAINPGNSGGPLVNLRGDLIGLNVAVFREGQGIGFAIPVKRLSDAVSEIFTPEKVKGLWFGARLKPGPAGVVAATVEPGSPAEKAGLRVGDIIVRANERPVRTAIDVSRELIETGDKRQIGLQVQRRNEHRTCAVQLVPEREVFNAALIRQKLGLTVQELPADVAAQMGLNAGDGLLITAVEKSSPAARANVIRGYVLRSVDGQAAESVKETARLLHAHKAGDTVELGLVVSRVRGNFLEIRPAKTEVAVR
jgi:S1-C subfamily serine protease